MGFIIFWKKKGIFIIVYLFVFFFIVLLISELLNDFVGGVFTKGYNRMWLYGFTCILSGIATMLSDVYTLKKGKLVRDEYQFNEIYFVPMKFAGKILIGFGILNIIGAIFEG